MSENELPQNTKEDYLHATIKGGLSNIPFVGGIIGEFFGLAVKTPIQKRQEIWLESLYEKIDFLKTQNIEYDVENLRNNENFVSVIIQTSQQAVKNHKVEKLEFLRNATINSITSKIDFEDQVIFLNYIETFTLLHIKFLVALENRGLNGIDSKSDQLSDVSIYNINSNAPEWKRKHVLQELDNRGLIEKNYHLQYNSTNMSLKISISEFGKEFLKYIRK